MTAFFMLSGISLSYIYNNKDLLNMNEYCYFIKKRMISIYPGYIVLYLLFVLKLLITKNMGLTIEQNLIVLPVELTLLQSVFGNSFATLHNGGTWFVSCIFLCYLLYPFLSRVIFQLKKKQILLFCCFCFLLLSWAPIVERFMSYSSIYANPFFRMIEFTLGICVVRMIQLYPPPVQKYGSFIICFICQVLLFVFVSIIRYFFKIGDYCMYNFLTVPLFMLIYYFGMNINNVCFDALFEARLMKYLSKISYIFFLAQFFTWDIYNFLVSKGIYFNNLTGFLTSFLICMFITILMYEFMAKPLSLLLKKTALKNYEENIR